MKAARLAGFKRFEFVETPAPSPEDGECLIKMEKLSICGSDIHNVYVRERPEEEYPLTIGAPNHECAGVVVESRTDEIKEGQRVIVLPSGRGGLVEYMTSKPGRMIPLPDHGNLDEWVMCQHSGTVLYSVQQMGNVLGKRVVVLGQGGIGLSFAMITARQGAKDVIASDPVDFRLEMSQKLSGAYTINPDRENIVEAVQELTEGEGADIVVDAAGTHQAFNDCFRLVKKFGKVIIFASQDDNHVLLEDHMQLLTKQPTIIPTVGGASGDPTTHIKEIVRLKDKGWVDPGQLVTHRLGFDDVQQAYDMYEQRTDNVIKAVMSL